MQNLNQKSEKKKGDLTDEQKSERAKANWKKLRIHVKSMQVKANFLVTFLDGEQEKGQENAFDSKEEGK